MRSAKEHLNTLNTVGETDMNNRVDINRLLTEMNTLKSQTQAFGGINGLDKAGVAPGVSKPNGPQFGDLFSQAVNKVNDIQQASSQTAQAYIRGDQSVDISDVMIASQKSSVAFQAMTQVRNKVVEAYKDVMNMPI